MRPKSMLWFDWLYLAALAIGLIASIQSFDFTLAQNRARPNIWHFGGPTLQVMIALGFLLSVIWWFLIARRCYAWAKWIWLVFLLFDVIYLRSLVQMAQSGAMMPLTLGLMGLQILLKIASAFCLFRQDARAWFAAKGKPLDAAIFD